MRDHYKISELCNALDVSSSSYYAACEHSPSKRHCENQKLLMAMKTIHDHRHTRAYRSPRMAHAPARNAQQTLPAETTWPDHAACPSPNFLADAGQPAAPGEQLVSDITDIPSLEGWLYLAIVLDLHSRAILGWKLAESLNADLVTAVLGRCLDSDLVRAGAIFHSDRSAHTPPGSLALSSLVLAFAKA